MKHLPLRASKRRTSQESSGSNGSSKEAKVCSIQSHTSPAKFVKSNVLQTQKEISRSKGKNRNEGTSLLRNRTQSKDRRTFLTGCHLETDNNTWLCYICKCYDPVYNDKEIDACGDTTEWIGCDCERWYHKYCTRLTVIDDNFSCKTMNAKCLQPKKEQKLNC